MNGVLPVAGTVAGEAVRAAFVAVAYLGVFVVVELWRRWAAPPVEWTRKTAHVGGGLVALPFPWIFGTHWTVLALGLATGALLWATRRFGALGSVHGVERRTEGGLYYPAAIYLLFLLGSARPVFYVVSVLTLVLSDALAALVGSRYGRTTYAVETHRRSVEGSAVFFLVTFLGVQLPLLLLTGIDREVIVLTAAQIALLVTFLEAISLHGADNLVVPLATYYFLIKITPQTAGHIASQLVSQLAIIAAVALLARRSRFLTASGALAAALMFYGAWGLGGPEWIVAPGIGLAIALAFYARLRRGRPSPGSTAPAGRYQVRAVFYTSVVPVALYTLNNAFETLLPVPAALRTMDPFYPLYVGAFAAHLGILLLDWIEGGGRFPASPASRRLLAAGPALFGVVPVGLAVGSAGVTTGAAAAATAVCAIAFALYAVGRRSRRWPHEQPWVFRLQTTSVAAAIGAVMPLQLAALLGAGG